MFKVGHENAVRPLLRKQRKGKKGKEKRNKRKRKEKFIETLYKYDESSFVLFIKYPYIVSTLVVYRGLRLTTES